jgi:hypothetical protein
LSFSAEQNILTSDSSGRVSYAKTAKKTWGPAATIGSEEFLAGTTQQQQKTSASTRIRMTSLSFSVIQNQTFAGFPPPQLRAGVRGGH